MKMNSERALVDKCEERRLGLNLAIEMALEHHESKYMRELCIWASDCAPDLDGHWNTACGQIHVFSNGGPDDNCYNYCSYCGKAIREITVK